jgi:hypothetical protein
MNPIEWFYAKGDKHSGPVNSVELKRMATVGELKPDDLVWREGMADWTVARNVRGLFEEESKQTGHANGGVAGGQSMGAPPKLIEPVAMPAATATVSPTAFATTTPQVQNTQQVSKHLFDVIIDLVRTQFSASFVESSTKLFVLIGKFGLFAAMGLTLLFAILMTVKESPFNSMYLTDGVISFLVLAVLQYVGGRFCEAGERLNRSTSENLCSTVFLDCLALLVMLSGASGLIFSLYIGFHGLYWAILAGLAGFVVAQFLAFIAIHPSLVNINLVAEMRPSDEALGLLAFFSKAFLRLAPIVFGSGVLFGSALLLYACIQIFTSSGPNLAELNSILATISLRYAGSIPLIAYLLFLLVYLLLDILRAILVLPSKLEKLGNQEEK